MTRYGCATLFSYYLFSYYLVECLAKLYFFSKKFLQGYNKILVGLFKSIS